MTKDDADKLALRFTAWAQGQPSVLALAIVGSWARHAARPDSDLDLLVLTDRLDEWTCDPEWVNEAVVSCGFQPREPQLEVYGVAKTWRVLVSPDVELEITMARPSWADIDPIDDGSRRVAGDGIQILVDKDGRLANLQSAVS